MDLDKRRMEALDMENLEPKFKIDIRDLSDHNLKRYKNFLLDCILGKIVGEEIPENTCVIILDRVEAVTKEIGLRKI